MEPSISKYLNTKGCALGLPISGNFELTARCNFDCKMCYVHLKDNIDELKKKELTADQWLSIASDARDQGMVFLLLTGGEPFVRDDFEEIYRELTKMGFLISINSNASLYDGDIRKLLKAYPPSRINVTLYGGSEETYFNLCGNASYGKVIDNLKKMKEDNLQVRLNVSLTPHNVHDMELINKASQNIGLHAKATSYMYPPVRVTGETGSNIGRFDAATAGETRAAWNYIRDEEERFESRASNVLKCLGMNCSENQDVDDQNGVMCRAGRSSFWMTWDGKMLPCGTMDFEPAYPLEIGFKKAWDDIRNRVSEIRLPAECTKCNLKNFCGVCAANCKAETGDFSSKPQYLCDMAEAYCNKVLDLSSLK
ncbi:MAG: radical SAM protein [Eubacterium sp.]|nr:radical SAM protein [Eubacterium sp.]